MAEAEEWGGRKGRDGREGRGGRVDERPVEGRGGTTIFGGVFSIFEEYV